MAFLPNKTQFQSFLQSVDNQNYKGRESAYYNLLDIGLPTKRDEHWQYTDLSKLLKTNYQLANDKLQDIDKNTIAIGTIKNGVIIYNIDSNEFQIINKE